MPQNDNNQAELEVSLYGTNVLPGDKAVSVDSSGRLNTNIVASLPAGSNLLGGLKLIDSAGTNAAAVDGSGNLSVKFSAALPAGSNLIGKFGIDQTTPGVTNAVQFTNTTLAVTGAFWQATQPVSLASAVALAAQPAVGIPELVAPASLPVTGTHVVPGVNAIAPEQLSFIGGTTGIVTHILNVVVAGYPVPAS